MPKLLAFLCLLPVVAFVGGCSSDKEDDAIIERDFPAIHIEAPDPLRGAREIVMPDTGLRYSVIGRPVVPQGNFLGTKVFEVGPPELRREALLVQVDKAASNQLFRLSGQARGKRLFLLVGDKPVGVHPIEDDMRSGNLFFDVEVGGSTPEEKHKAISALEQKLNEVILRIIKKKEDK